jgi:hypothetical protein
VSAEKLGFSRLPTHLQNLQNQVWPYFFKACLHGVSIPVARIKGYLHWQQIRVARQQGYLHWQQIRVARQQGYLHLQQICVARQGGPCGNH